jgi:hypothetical protein
MKDQVMYNGELHDMYIDEEGYTVLHKSKNKNGFNITIRFSNDPEDNQIAMEALENFYVKN